MRHGATNFGDWEVACPSGDPMGSEALLFGFDLPLTFEGTKPRAIGRCPNGPRNMYPHASTHLSGSDSTGFLLVFRFDD
jgi:hypothetical protein